MVQSSLSDRRIRNTEVSWSDSLLEKPVPMLFGMSFFLSTSLVLLTLMLQFYTENVLLYVLIQKANAQKNQLMWAINRKDLKINSRKKRPWCVCEDSCRERVYGLVRGLERAQETWGKHKQLIAQENKKTRPSQTCIFRLLQEILTNKPGNFLFFEFW